MSHENNNIGGRAEHPGSDEQKISQLLGGLKRVEAPPDFEFHLKARIAKGRPAERGPAAFFPILKYALPLGLFLAVGAGMFLYSSYSSPVDQAMVTTPGETSISNSAAAPAPDEPASPVTAANDDKSVAALPPDQVAEPERTAAVPGPRPPVDRQTTVNSPRNPTRSRETVPSGGSADKAVGIEQRVLVPRGMSGLNATGVKDLLGLMDAEAGFEGNAWVIKSVKSNGIADQMGLKAGDKLKTINGMAVGERTEFQRSFSASTIEVQRNGKTVELGAGRTPERDQPDQLD